MQGTGYASQSHKFAPYVSGFCDLRSQKTPRGILPVNSNVNVTVHLLHQSIAVSLWIHLLAFEAQEYRQTFKRSDRIAQRSPQVLPAASSRMRRPERTMALQCADGNQVHIHRKFGISATLDDADSDRHLIRHFNHDHTHNNHEVVCIQSSLRVNRYMDNSGLRQE